MIKKSFQFLKRTLSKPGGLNPDSILPVSEYFGEDRGTPIDRYYIEQFLGSARNCIKGDLLEIAQDTYIKQFGSDIKSVNILHPVEGSPNATIIGDLTQVELLPADIADCFICTQTFNFIYNYQDAIKGSYKLIKPGGVLLATVAGISQISKFDMDRWGDYWRFTTLSAKKSFEQVFGEGNVEVNYYGNCFAAITFLRGISLEEVNKKDLEIKDGNYPVTITIKATKIQSV
jgi:hypothetical protein